MTANIAETGLTIIFAKYLSELRKQERRKPKSQRRVVPTSTTLAESIRNRYPGCNIHQTTISNIANGHRDLLPLRVVQLILDEMHYAGFDTDITHFIQYTSPSDKIIDQQRAEDKRQDKQTANNKQV